MPFLIRSSRVVFLDCIDILLLCFHPLLCLVSYDREASAATIATNLRLVTRSTSSTLLSMYLATSALLVVSFPFWKILISDSTLAPSQGGAVRLQEPQGWDERTDF